MNTSIKKRFSTAATTYDRHATVQSMVAEKVIGLTQALPAPYHLLEIGCGTGQLTKRLCERYPTTTIDALDVSGSMLDQAKLSPNNSQNIRWIQADIKTHEHVGYDMIASSSALHWVEPLEDCFQRIYGMQQDGGFFVASIMLRHTLEELHASRIRVAPHKKPLGQLPLFEDVLKIMTTCGWEILYDEPEKHKIVYPSAHDFLQSIHAQGSTGGSVSQSDDPLTRQELNRLIADYDTTHKNSDGTVYATYRIGFVTAKK